MGFLDKVQGFSTKFGIDTEKGIDKIIGKYNDKIDSLHRPTVQVEVAPDKNVYYMIGLVLVVILFIFRKKIF